MSSAVVVAVGTPWSQLPAVVQAPPEELVQSSWFGFWTKIEIVSLSIRAPLSVERTVNVSLPMKFNPPW